MKTLLEINTFKRLIESRVFEINEDLNGSRIALFPGAYKPPHKGHFHTASVAASKTDCLYIIISNAPREDINGETAYDIWSIYKEYIEATNPNSHVEIQMLDYAASPVAITYQIANILNNGHFVPGDKANDQEALPGIEDIGNDILHQYSNNITLVPVAGKGDGGRYRGLSRSDKYVGDRVEDIDILEVERLTSASNVRAAILAVAQGQGDGSTIRQNLPDILSPEDEEKILSILLGDA
jgi:hypothetical protein